MNPCEVTVYAQKKKKKGRKRGRGKIRYANGHIEKKKRNTIKKKKENDSLVIREWTNNSLGSNDSLK